MKTLFCITVVLSVLWVTSAAPQLFSLTNLTISELNDLSTTTIHEITSPENIESTSPASSDSKEISPSSLDSSTVSFDALEEFDEKSDVKIKHEEKIPDDNITPDNDANKSTFTSNVTVDAFTNAVTTSLKPTENGETLNESEIPITRYVPPLDPIKHMLMMADIKGMSNFPHLLPKVNIKPEKTTNANPTIKEFETTVYTASNNDSFVAETTGVPSKDSEKLVTETTVVPSKDSEKLVTETTSVVSTDNSNNESYETTVEDSSKKIFEVEPTERITYENSSDIIETSEPPLDITTDIANSEESIEKIIANESSEKVISEPSEIDINDEKVVNETTVGDFTTIPAIVLMKSDDLSSVETFDSETLDDFSITSTSTTQPEEITLDSAEETTKFEEKEDTIIKLSDTEINVKETTDEINKNVTVNEDETTSAIYSSTEEAIQIENFTSSDSLLKNNYELKADLPDSTSESTTLSALSSETETELEITSTTTSKEVIDLTFTTTATEVKETTSKQFEITTELEAEPEGNRRNISLDDELEFRAVKFPQNVSKVSYVEKDIVDDLATFEDSSETTDGAETSTMSIFTTIAEILFSSSSTEAPTKISEITETVAPEEAKPTENLPLKGDSDSGTVLINDPSDAEKVQSITPALDSVPSEDTTVAISSDESISLDLEPEELLKSEKEFEDLKEKEFADLSEKVVDENQENNSETTVKIDTTTLTSLKTEATTKHFTPTTIPEIENEDIELKAIESSEDETGNNEETSSEEKPSDYLFDTKNRYISGNNTDMVAAVQFLHYHDKASSEQCFKLVNAHWNYATNLTEENKIKQLEQTLEYSLFHKDAWKNVTSFAWKTFNDTLLRRWFKSLSVLGNAALPEDKLNELNRLKAEMKNTYSTAKICAYIPPEEVKKGQILQEKDCNLSLEPDLQRILTKSRDYDELVHVWKSYRDAAGKPIAEKYLRFVELGNEAARINGFSDIGDMWREDYESETFENDLEELWDQLRPLYENLHAYVRRRLIQQYGADKIKEDGPIPAHLFGNMWAQSWVSLLDITQPFAGKPSVDVTPIMQAKNLTAHEMFKISEEFFTSLGLKAMPETFWKYSLIEKPKDREIICHASAWDFCNGKDYRIKQCTDITMEDLITVHHEMGHIQYFMQYSRQPNVFREGANPGFHEAIGDVIALSVSTPKHLQSIGLLDEVADDPEGDLNFLLYTALDKVSFLPTGYLFELWRWGLFSGEIKPEEMNTKWWELRLKYQGVCPPVKRTDTDFDPGAKYHIAGHVPYIRYFVSFVIQFQFHKVLCDAAGHTGPLYKCDIYRSREAGQILSQVMELGSSEHWSEAMKIMTGGATNKMDAGPILEYFEPLLDFLIEQNKNETLGWRSDDPTICP